MLSGRRLPPEVAASPSRPPSWSISTFGIETTARLLSLFAKEKTNLTRAKSYRSADVDSMDISSNNSIINTDNSIDNMAGKMKEGVKKLRRQRVIIVLVSG